MEEDGHATAVDGNECGDTETVTPSPIDTFACQHIVHSPSVPLGLLHKDHSDNEDDTDVQVRESPAQLLTSGSKLNSFFMILIQTPVRMKDKQRT
jgi:hypothetical protein